MYIQNQNACPLQSDPDVRRPEILLVSNMVVKNCYNHEKNLSLKKKEISI